MSRLREKLEALYERNCNVITNSGLPFAAAWDSGYETCMEEWLSDVRSILDEEEEKTIPEIRDDIYNGIVSLCCILSKDADETRVNADEYPYEYGYHNASLFYLQHLEKLMELIRREDELLHRMDDENSPVRGMPEA